MLQSISALPVGTLVKDVDTQLDGVPIVWMVLDHNHEDYPANSITLFSKYALFPMAFDAAETGNSNGSRASYGNNRWRTSNARLNGNSDGLDGEWWTAQNLTDGVAGANNHDAPPTAAHVYNAAHAYDNRPGFLQGFSDGFKSGLLNTRTVTQRNTATDGGGDDITSDKIFLLSTTELGAESDTGGVEFTYFVSGSKAATTASGTQVSWWTRSIQSQLSTNYVDFINRSGSLSEGSAYGDFAEGFNVYFRPACNISDNVVVSDAPDSDGAYIIDWENTPNPPPIVDPVDTYRQRLVGKMKGYADYTAGAAETAAKSYSDTGDTGTLETANNFTTQAVAAVVNNTYGSAYWFGREDSATEWATAPAEWTGTIARAAFDFSTNTPYSWDATNGYVAGTAITPANGEAIGITSAFLDLAADAGRPGIARYSADNASWDYYPDRSLSYDGVTIAPRASDGAIEVPEGALDKSRLDTAVQTSLDKADVSIPASAIGVAVQAQLTFDETPTESSDNPVTSGGIYSALQGLSPGGSKYMHNVNILQTGSTYPIRMALLIVNNVSAAYTSALDVWTYLNDVGMVDTTHPCLANYTDYNGAYRLSVMGCYAFTDSNSRHLFRFVYPLLNFTIESSGLTTTLTDMVTAL